MKIFLLYLFGAILFTLLAMTEKDIGFKMFDFVVAVFCAYRMIVRFVWH